MPNRGDALLVVAAAGEPAEQALAWDALRNQAKLVPHAALLTRLAGGVDQRRAGGAVAGAALQRASCPTPPSCPWWSPTPAAVASRCGSTPTGPWPAWAATTPGRRCWPPVATAPSGAATGCGWVSPPAGPWAPWRAGAPDGPLTEASTWLVDQAGDADGHLAMAALQAMAALAQDRALPPEAAAQESLLPVWRIRLARAARGHLDDRETGPRAAAAAAYAALRGAGGLADLRARLDTESAPSVQAALLTATMALDPDPARYLVAPGAAIPPRSERNPMIDAAIIDAFVARAADLDRAAVDGFLAGAALTGHPVARATAAAHLGAFPGDFTAAATLAVGRAPAGPWHGDLVLAALGSVAAMWAVPDSVWTSPADLDSTAADLLRRCFDDPDLRIRLEARKTALATGLLPENLIPGEPSLRATLPAARRDPAQPPLALPFQAPRVRVATARGDFEIALDGEAAPNTCAMFLDLTRRGFYDGLTFHRVVPDFVDQGGDPTGTGWGGPGYTIRSEWSPQAYTRGTVGIAHSGKDTGGCQWFVTLSEQPHLVGRYTVFGHVTRGMEALDAIEPGDTFTIEVLH